MDGKHKEPSKQDRDDLAKPTRHGERFVMEQMLNPAEAQGIYRTLAVFT